MLRENKACVITGSDTVSVYDMDRSAKHIGTEQNIAQEIIVLEKKNRYHYSTAVFFIDIKFSQSRDWLIIRLLHTKQHSQMCNTVYLKVHFIKMFSACQVRKEDILWTIVKCILNERVISKNRTIQDACLKIAYFV